jgi:Spy/CpxP family protein refolding chaperone
MFRQRLVLLGVLAAAMMATSGLFGDEAVQGQGKKGLPPLWSKLGLSEEQKKKVQSIQAQYSARIAALHDQIKQIQSEERAMMVKVLTSAQKDHLKGIAAEKAGLVDSDADSKSPTTDGKKKDDKKESDKK